MYILPNGNKIDENGLIDALAEIDSKIYFLDTESGSVGIVETSTSQTILQLHYGTVSTFLKRLPAAGIMAGHSGNRINSIPKPKNGSQHYQ